MFTRQGEIGGRGSHLEQTGCHHILSHFLTTWGGGGLGNGCVCVGGGGGGGDLLILWMLGEIVEPAFLRWADIAYMNVCGEWHLAIVTQPVNHLLLHPLPQHALKPYACA